MNIVLDTNVFISCLLSNSLSRFLLSSKNVVFFIAEYSLEEINEHRLELIEKFGEEREFDEILSFLLSKLRIVKDDEIKPFKEQAKEIMDLIDKDDTPVIAVALAINADGIWSFDSHFKRQNRIRVFETNEILRLTN